MNIVLTSLSVETAVGAASVQFGAMTTTGPIGAPSARYRFISTTACWILQGSSPVATAGAGSMFVNAGEEIFLSGSEGAKLAVIQNAAGGLATLTPVLVV